MTFTCLQITPASLSILSPNSIPLRLASTYRLISVLILLGLVLQPHTQSILENCLCVLRGSVCALFLKYLRANDMAHRVMALDIKSDDLRSVTQTYMVGGESTPYTHQHCDTHPHAPTQNKDIQKCVCVYKCNKIFCFMVCAHVCCMESEDSF